METREGCFSLVWSIAAVTNHGGDDCRPDAGGGVLTCLLDDFLSASQHQTSMWSCIHVEGSPQRTFSLLRWAGDSRVRCSPARYTEIPWLKLFDVSTSRGDDGDGRRHDGGAADPTTCRVALLTQEGRLLPLEHCRTLICTQKVLMWQKVQYNYCKYVEYV